MPKYTLFSSQKKREIGVSWIWYTIIFFFSKAVVYLTSYYHFRSLLQEQRVSIFNFWCHYWCHPLLLGHHFQRLEYLKSTPKHKSLWSKNWRQAFNIYIYFLEITLPSVSTKYQSKLSGSCTSNKSFESILISEYSARVIGLPVMRFIIP